jgi:hypothetical protein
MHLTKGLESVFDRRRKAKPVQLTVKGNSLEDSLGRFIDGNNDGKPGGNRAVVITKTGVTVTS